MTESFTSVFQMFASLAFVLALIFGLGWMLKRVQRLRGSSAAAPMRIEAGLQVGARERVVLLQVGGQHVLVGVAPGQVRTLHVFAQEPGKPAPALTQESPFSQRLLAMLNTKPLA